MSLFTKIVAPLKAMFSGLGRSFGAFFQSLAESIAANGGPILLSAAMAAVAAAESKGGTGKEKLKYAQDAVEATLTQRGIPIAWNAVNGALEAAVAEYNKNVAGR